MLGKIQERPDDLEMEGMRTPVWNKSSIECSVSLGHCN
jgi:hypothetical protein